MDGLNRTVTPSYHGCQVTPPAKSFRENDLTPLFWMNRIDGTGFSILTDGTTFPNILYPTTFHWDHAARVSVRDIYVTWVYPTHILVSILSPQVSSLAHTSRPKSSPIVEPAQVIPAGHTLGRLERKTRRPQNTCCAGPIP